MRIKCPNSDIMLELPGDRTDMKFSCPACHKVHRVTVAITTPGEDSQAAGGTRSVVRTQPHMPKKYATGAFAPVVDVPIDANFVLMDDSVVGQQMGIDLGRAAEPPPPFVDRDLGNRKTEIIRDNRPAPGDAVAPPLQTPQQPEPPPAPAPEPAAVPQPPAPEADRAASRRVWDEATSAPAAPRADDAAHAHPHSERTAPRETPGPSARLSSRRQARPARAPRGRILIPLLIVVLAAGGYVGWQQYRFSQTKGEIDTLLAKAESEWERGDAGAAARYARQAGETIEQGGRLHTPAALWNLAAAETGLFQPAPPPLLDAGKAAERHLERERVLGAFKTSMARAAPEEMASLLADAGKSAGEDSALRRTMERAVADAIMADLERNAESLPPEASRAKAQASRRDVAPALSDETRRDFENRLSAFADAQRRNLSDEIRRDIADVARGAAAGDSDSFARYDAVRERVRLADIPELSGSLLNLAEDGDRDGIRQLESLADVVSRARVAARTALSRPDAEEDDAVDGFVDQAKAIASPNAAMVETAVREIEATRAVTDDLLGLRVELYGRLQSEMRRNRDYPGTRMAWAMLRSAFDDPKIEVDPAGFRYDSNRATMVFAMNSLPGAMEMTEEDYEKSIRARIAGYRFTAGWALLFHKPMLWMARLAEEMRAAGIDANRFPEWEVIEGPGAPLALSIPGAASATAVGSLADGEGRHIFFKGRLYPVRELPQREESREIVETFRNAAKRLEEAVMADENISQPLRQALKPVLMGTYQPPDPRDYFDSAFCRRLIEADYLETYIDPMPAAIGALLGEYREALEKMEDGCDEFSAQLDDGGTLYAVIRPDAEISGSGKGGDQDPETGESLPRYTWRVENDDKTVFFSPQPARFVYAFVLAEHFPGRHDARPAGVPELTEVLHMTHGLVASYRDGASSADGDDDMWNAAIAEDSSGRFDPSSGTPGWSYPLHVLQRDDQDDPVRLATLNGTVDSPDFSQYLTLDDRRRAEDEWLDHTAEVLSTPGELSLIFHQFFRYCSDSPLPELPNLIGSHFGLSDTHQTVYESLERRWVGRLIGDCDDLAEFFQVLTRRQGKLSHVMQLPGHAAAGYVEKIPDEDAYRFVVLQTGPAQQFVAPTLNDVVEMAYRSFDRGDGISHMTTDAVPLLLRFADEETRTPFVLSARIYGDAEYADTMIRVQSYWHEHVYSAAIEVMEKMVEEDKEIGSIKELGSLYERVGDYDRSETMRREELDMVRDNPQAMMSTLLEIVQLHFQEKDYAKSLEALGEMEEVMLRMIRADDAAEFFRAMTFRSYWAMYLARLNQPDRAWLMIRYDATMTKRQLGRVAEPVLRTMVVLYDRMCILRDKGSLDRNAEKAMEEVKKELEEAFGRGYFKSDDSYNNIIGRFFVMGRYAVSDVGRSEGLDRLLADGPYPDGAEDHTRRGKTIRDDDWRWFRIVPQLYLAFGMEMLDREEYPEFYDPERAKPLLDDVARAVEKGTGLGSDVAGSDDLAKAELTLSFLNNDLQAFRAAMAKVKEKNYSSLYDDAAMTFGLHCGLVPLADFRDWTEAFREFFPGSQHYFKVVYRAIDKEHYDHALIMAESTARFFPDHELLLREAEFVRSIIPGLKERKLRQENRAPDAAKTGEAAKPAA